jgi:hypothetical protein
MTSPAETGKVPLPWVIFLLFRYFKTTLMNTIINEMEEFSGSFYENHSAARPGEAHGGVSRDAAQPAHGHVTRVRSVLVTAEAPAPHTASHLGTAP